MTNQHDMTARVGRQRSWWLSGAPLLGALVALSACATVDPAPDYERAAASISEATGVEEAHQRDVADELDVDALLEEGLDVDAAVRVALLKSPALDEQFVRIGIARAEWVQSGLLQNPTVGMAILLPEGGGRSLIEGAIAQQIADVWRIPLRREAAEHEVNAAVLTTARTAGRIAHRVRDRYYEALAAEEHVALAEADLGLVRQAYEATQRAHELGRATELEVRLARLRRLNAQASLGQRRQDAERARQDLAYAMSLDRRIQGVELTSDWPTWRDPGDDETLIATARARRPDLQAATHLAEAEGVRIDLERRSILPDLTLGAQLERPERASGEGDGIDLVLGPSASLEIPIFDQNQAQIARAGYEQRVAYSTYRQLHLRIGHEVRQAAHAARLAADRMALYADEALAEADASVEQARRAHGAGHIDRLTLIDTKRTRLDAIRAYLVAQLDTAQKLIALDSALGGPPRQADLQDLPER